MRHLICIGDSLVRGIGWSNNSSPVKPLNVRLSEKYPGIRVVNLGIGSETTTQLNARKSAVDSYAPFRVMVWSGVNDVFADIDAATIQSNLQAIYTYFSGQGYEVVALTIPPRDGDSSARNTVRNTVNNWIRNTATGLILKVDAWSIIADPTDTTRRLPAYAADDPISPSHINDAAYAALVEAL